MGEIGKVLIFFGIALITIGILLILFEKLPLGLGKLPGDIYIKRDNFVVYIPITTAILISLLLTLILNLVFLLLKK